MTLRCADCLLLYSSPKWCDFVVPDSVWATIAPVPCVLCVQCMINRANAAGVQAVGQFTSGPFSDHDWQKPQ